jgi:peptide/nickel transport system permease protein
MGVYAAKRTAALIPVLLGVAVVTFILLLLIPGDPATALYPDSTPEAREQIRHELHLDDRVDLRFRAWLGNVLQGDLGTSISRHEPAVDVVGRAAVNTGKLALAAILISIPLGIGAGLLAGWFADARGGRWINGVVITAASLPQFWLGLMLLYVFALKLPWLPTGGMGPIIGDASLLTDIRYMTLPAITVALLPLAIIARLTRTLILELKRQEFVLALRTRGYSQRRIMRHVLRNAAPGIVNIAGLQAGYIVLGTLFAEVVFNWPGLGTAIATSIASRDCPVIQAIVLMSGVLFACLTIVVDLTMRLLDPRLQS